MYGAAEIVFSKNANSDLATIERLGFGGLPICMAKTPASLSDDASRLGRPHDFPLAVRGIQINAGAGFLVVLTGDILRMPGLPRRPRAESVDVDGGRVIGVD
jgi:formate--tetrahydrofolate ligase